MRNSAVTLGVWQVFSEELSKAAVFLCFKARESVTSTAQACRKLAGAETGAGQQHKRRKHREVYEEILRKKQQAAQETARRAMEGKSFKEQVTAMAYEVLEGIKNATSTKAGALALLQHCAAAHAAEVAVEQGIDVKNVSMQFEERKEGTKVGSQTVVVGYIDAPNASDAEMMAFAEQLNRRCPVANAMRGRIEWRRAGGEMRNGGAEEVNGSSVGDGAPSEESAPPRGMPGARYHNDKNSSREKSNGDTDSDELHLPGVKKGKDREAEDGRGGRG